MLKAFKLKKDRKWLNIFFIGFAILLLVLKGMSNPNTFLFSIILFIIGSFREDIYVDPKGIVFRSCLLFIIPLKTICPFHEATNISFERLDDEFTILKYFKGNKLKRIRIKKEDIKSVKEWINISKKI